MSTTPNVDGLSTVIVESVLRELMLRDLFDHWWDSVDPATKKAIIQDLIVVVRGKIEEGPSAKCNHRW